MGDHDPGLQMRRGQLHDHRVHVRESPQRRALVLDAVLRADHRDVRARRRFEALERGGGVLALDRQQHDVVVAPGDLLGERDDLDRLHEHPVGGFEAQPRPRDRLAMRAAGDQHDIMAVLEQPAADGPADRSRAVNDEPRHPASGYSNAACPVRALPRISVWIWWVPS